MPVHQHYKLRRAGRAIQRTVKELEMFVLVAAGMALIVASCCMVALTIRVWPVIGNVRDASAQAKTTLASLQKTSDNLAALEAAGLPVLEGARQTLAGAQATVRKAQEQIVRLGNVADAFSIFVNDTNLRVNDELLPKMSGTVAEIGRTAQSARQTLNEGRETLAQFKLTYADNAHIRKMLANYDATSLSIRGIADHGEKVVADTQVVTDYAAKKVKEVEKPKGMLKVAGAFSFGVAVKVFIQTVANILSRR